MEQGEKSLEARIAEKFPLPGEQPEQSLPDPTEQPDEGSTEQVEETPFVDIEYEGKSYKVPPEIKDSLMARADYTTKTQQLARNREALELAQQHIKSFAEHQQFEKSLAGELKSVEALKFKLADKKDPDRFKGMDSASLMKESFVIQGLEQELYEKTQALESKRAEFKNYQAQQMQSRLEAARTALSRSIPNWSPEVAEKISKHALARGWTQHEVGNITDHRFVELLHESMQLAEIRGQKGDVLSKAQKAPPVIKPGAVKAMPQGVKDQFAHKKQLEKTKKEGGSEGAIARVIQQRLEQKLRRFS